MSKLLNGKVGETVVLQVTANPTPTRRTRRRAARVEIQAVDREHDPRR